LFYFLLVIQHTLYSTLFPYTTLFRSMLIISGHSSFEDFRSALGPPRSNTWTCVPRNAPKAAPIGPPQLPTAVKSATFATSESIEIGRASCREREKISEVANLRKKKKE